MKGATTKGETMARNKFKKIEKKIKKVENKIKKYQDKIKKTQKKMQETQKKMERHKEKLFQMKGRGGKTETPEGQGRGQHIRVGQGRKIIKRNSS